MPQSRRAFLEQAAALGLLYGTERAIAQAMPGMKMGGISRTAAPVNQAANVPMLHTLQLAPFVDPLPLPEIIRPGGPHHRLTVTMREIHAKVHRDVPTTRMWSYGPDAMAPVIEARAHQPIEITWVNQLPQQHFLPIDYSLHGSGHDVPQVRTVAHLHGAKVPSKYDGYPEDWFPVGGSRTCIYPMQQEAATLWYHDHAMGLNRLNTYAGLVGMLLLRDEKEDALNLPKGKYEVPLVLYDRNFSQDGQLFYGTSGDANSPWVSEFYADGLMVNGRIKPYLEVEPRLYRFRIVNTANSRFYVLSLSGNATFTQIGSDQGLLPSPVKQQRLILGCAERADILIDFSRMAGQNVQMRTGAQDMLQFRVAAHATSTANNVAPPALPPVVRIREQEAVQTRTITLHDYKDQYEQTMVMLLNRKHWHEPTTEKPKLNSTEIWEFVNLTEDTHPMHIHLVRFQVLDRQPFDLTELLMNKKRVYIADAEKPAAHEMGWKDTVQCPPRTVTRVIMKFEGYIGKYLYHCHILEHEANDMMRPFEVVA
ncbi:multicopper oxidase family protein [Terriglobus roseus]|uniref:multicopper oxidase family protein n=1 Tax=Terriglobus roseus TaxID=392734 RepID=UPI0009429098|nr:multicopper oxidase domain-containing protein [Terriglobus roseus]